MRAPTAQNHPEGCVETNDSALYWTSPASLVGGVGWLGWLWSGTMDPKP